MKAIVSSLIILLMVSPSFAKRVDTETLVTDDQTRTHSVLFENGEAVCVKSYNNFDVSSLDLPNCRSSQAFL